MRRAEKEAACTHHSTSAASEQELLRQYSSIKQLISAKSFDQALSKGWTLLEGVKAAYVAKSTTRCLQELFAAASLNVVICMAEAPDLTALPQLNAAVSGLFSDLRQQMTTTAAAAAAAMRQALTLSKCLLKVVSVVGRELAAQQHASDQQQSQLQELLMWLVSSAWLCGQAQLPQQVAFKASQELSSCVQHCLLAALAHAAESELAGISNSSSTCHSAQCGIPHNAVNIPCGVPPAVYITCMQHVVGNICLGGNSAAACVCSILAPHRDHTIMPELQATLVLLLAATCSKSLGRLPDTAVDLLTAAAHSTTQGLQLQLQGMQDDGAPALSGFACARLAINEACSRTLQQADTSTLQLALLRAQSWAGGHLVMAGSEMQRAVCPLVVSLAAHQVAAWQVACSHQQLQQQQQQQQQRDHQEHLQQRQQQQEPSQAELTARVLSNAVHCLAHSWTRGSQQQDCCRWDAAAEEVSGGSGRHAPAGLEQHVLQQQQVLTSALVHLTHWQHVLQASSQRPGTVDSTVSSLCDVRVLSLLEQEFNVAAVAVSSATPAAHKQVGSSSSSPSNAAVAASVRLQAAICMCALALDAAASPIVSAAESGSTTTEVEASRGQLQPCRAVGRLLQAVKPLLNDINSSPQLCHATPTTATSSRNAAGRPTTGALPQPADMLMWVQDIMLISARLVLRLPNTEQQQLKQQWQSVLRSYSRLRCTLAGAGCSTGSSTRTSDGTCVPGGKGRSRGRQQAAQCSLREAQEQFARLACDDEQAASQQQHQLPSVLQLVTTAAEAVTAAGQLGGTSEPTALYLDRLWVLEGAALAQVASSSVPEASAAMAHKLFLQLLADPFMSAQQSSQGPQAAHTLLARAMLLLLVPGDNTSSSESEVKQARRDLAQACHQFDLTLQLPAAASGCAALPAGASSSGGECCELSTTTHMGSGGFKHAGKPATAGSSRRRATKRSQRGQEEERGNDAPIAEGAATAGAGPNSLLSAALCHCLLGLLLAQTAATIGSSSNTQASNAADDSRQPACDEDTAGVAADADSAQDGGPQMATDAWLQVGSRLHSGSVYLQTYLAAVQASSCAASAGSSSRSCGAVWYADEAALAMMQVWHVAALQDWCHCQQPCLQVLGQLLWTLSQPIAQHATQFIQLAQVQQQLSTEILTSRPWLMQLMQQQTMAQAAAAAEVRKGPGGAGHVDAAASMASTSTNGRSTDKQSSRISSTQFEGAEASQQQAECCCQLRAQARALQDAAMKLGQQSPKANGEASGWQCLTRVQAQLAAAEAALWSGDIAAAAAEAELALQTCRSVLGSTGSLPVLSWGGRHGHCSSQGTATQWLPVGAMTASGSTGLHWHALGLYMSGLWQLSGTLEAAGNPQDAVRLLKELRRLSGSRGVFSFAVLAQASLSSIYSRMAQPAKAAAAASAAVQLLQVLQGLQAAEPSPAAAGSCVFALASAAVASAQAAVALGGQQPAAAQEHTTQGLAVLEGLQAVHAGGGAGGVKQAGWRWVSQYVQLLQQRAECHALLQDTAAALAALQAAARLLASQHTPCSRCPCGPWPTLWASVQVQLLEMTRLPNSTCGSSSSACSIGLVGFQTGSHSNDLLQAFTAAAAAAGAPLQDPTASEDGSHTLPNGGSSSNASSRRLPRGMAAAVIGRTAASSSTARWKAARNTGQGRSGASSTSRSSSVPTTPCSTAQSEGEYVEEQDPSARLCRTLQAASLACQHPLLMRRACMLLCEAFQALNAVNAAALFLHIALGASTTQRQFMLAVSRQRHAQHTPYHGSAQFSSSTAEAWARMQPLLSYAQVLTDATAAAQAACAAADDTCSSSSSVQGLAQSVDEAASSWLTATLQQLPQGVAVCSISRAADCTPASSEGVLVSRAVLGGGEDNCARVLLVQLPASRSSSSSNRQQCSSIHELLGELQAVLSDASASMAAASSSSLASTAAKSAWWRQRVSQDQRMAGLVQVLDQDLLGAWRCLLLPGAQQQVEAAAAAASQAIVVDHFDCVLDEKPRQLLAQMVALLVIHLGSCTTAELTQAAQQLSTLAQQRMDGLHLQRLLAEMEAAHAALPAPAQPAPQSATSSSRCSSAGNTAPKMPARSSSSSSAHSAAGALTASAPAAALPADAKAKLLSTPATRKPRSRCNTAGSSRDSMASRGPSAELGMGCVQQRDLHVLEAAPAATAAPHTHCKRSMAGASLPAAAPSTAVEVPPSIARHASRRSRLKAMNTAGTSNVSAVPLPTTSASQPRPRTQIMQQSQQRCQAVHDECATVSTATSCSNNRSGRSGSSSTSSTVTLLGSAAAPGCPEGWQGQRAAVLVLDQYMQCLPWESCPGLRQHSLYRCPGLAFAAALAARLQALQESDAALQLSNSFYVLNPDGDLADTQHSFEDTLKRICREGVAGSRPVQSRLVSALQQHDLFLYFGHGAGEQYLSAAAYRGLDRCAASLLMGCSSGRLRLAGEFEPHGPAWDYLMAGSPAVVANLWDVTDRDIDRFAARVLQKWSGAAAGDCAAAGDDALTDRDTGSGLVDVSAAISASRGACRLPALVGSAVVCCGLPASVQIA